MKKIKKPLFGILFLLLALTSCEYDGIDPISAVDAGADAGSPEITITYPTEGTAIKVPEAVTAIEIQLEVRDDIEVEKIEVQVNGNQIALFEEFTDYRIIKRTVNFDNVTNGAHTLAVIATDISGNVTTKEVNFSKEPPYTPKYASEFFYMPFDGDFMELVNIYTADEVGTPGISSASFLGTGAYRGVADSFITVPLNADDLGSDFSAAFWYKLSGDASRAAILVAGADENREQGFRLFREGDGISQTIKMNVGTGSGESWNDGGSVEVTGEWVHIAFSISASETILFVNGMPLRTAGMGNAIDWTGVEEITIGAGGATFSYWDHKSDTNSLIDELRLFNSALSQSDIQNLINASAETLYMPFNGQYSDMVSNREVTVVGNPGFAGESAEGSDAYAGAADSYLTLPSDGLLSEEFSTTFWYKVNASPDRAGILVISAVNETNPDGNNLNSGFHLFREGGAEEQRIKASVGTGTEQSWNDGGVIDVAAGAWVHVALTISDSESKIYLDGALMNTSALSGGVDWTGTDLVSIMSGAPRFIEWNHLADNSYMDELRFFNKVLTQDEIQAAMAD